MPGRGAPSQMKYRTSRLSHGTFIQLVRAASTTNSIVQSNPAPEKITMRLYSNIRLNEYKKKTAADKIQLLWNQKHIMNRANFRVGVA